MEEAEKIEKESMRKFNIAYVRPKGFAELAAEIRAEYKQRIASSLSKARTQERERVWREAVNTLKCKKTYWWFGVQETCGKERTVNGDAGVIYFCEVCSGPRRALIDAALADGVTIEKV